MWVGEVVPHTVGASGRGCCAAVCVAGLAHPSRSRAVLRSDSRPGRLALWHAWRACTPHYQAVRMMPKQHVSHRSDRDVGDPQGGCRVLRHSHKHACLCAPTLSSATPPRCVHNPQAPAPARPATSLRSFHGGTQPAAMLALRPPAASKLLALVQQCSVVAHGFQHQQAHLSSSGVDEATSAPSSSSPAAGPAHAACLSSRAVAQAEGDKVLAFLQVRTGLVQFEAVHSLLVDATVAMLPTRHHQSYCLGPSPTPVIACRAS